jgi:predicted ATP-grasp superfamily ATP-dependent carboligase
MPCAAFDNPSPDTLASMAPEATEGPPHGPVLMMAFSGWNDACDSATDVIGHLAEAYVARTIGQVPAGSYYDLQRHRPLVTVDADGRRLVSWATTEVLLAKHPQADLILVRGPEPSFRWDEFCADILTIAAPLAPTLAVSLGAVSADVPHTRDLPVRAFSQNHELATKLSVETTAYEGLTGITGIAADACDDAGIPSLRVWVSVPSYVSTPPCPPATLALLVELRRILGLDLDLGDLPDRSRLWTHALDELAAEQGLSDWVTGLQDTTDLEDQRSGDKLAEAILSFLRRRT